MKRIATITAAWLLVLFLVSSGVGDDDWVWVKHAVDGDTIRLRSGQLVRYLGIDAPEIDHQAKRAEPFGYKALELNRRLVEGQRIRLQTGQRKKDRYGRILAHPYDKKGRLISLEIVGRGLAIFYPHTSTKSSTQDELLLTEQRKAMQSRVGIWSQPMAELGPLIANRRTKRFHLKTCPYGQQTSRKNRFVPDSLKDALWNGYAPGRKCLGSP